MTSFLYLVHDLTDAAVRKRVQMIKAGGGNVTVAGFRRSSEPVHEVSGCPAIDLGQTFNANFKQRILSVFKTLWAIKKYKAAFEDANIIVARNLEMLAIAVRGRHMHNKQIPLIYESLDIHRLLLRNDAIGKSLRKLEGWLCSNVSRLWTSSPAFISGYFKPLSELDLPTTLIENKVFDPDNKIDSTHNQQIPPEKPWSIGWFGAIRCSKSLSILRQLVEQRKDVKVIIRGRPSYDQFDDFDAIISNTEGIEFLGSYQNPDDLPSIYGEVHFTWAIDMFEEGLNSSWLLPNRLYEGGYFSSVPIADKGVHTGEYIAELDLGVLLDEVNPSTLNAFFDTLTPEQYKSLKKKSEAIAKDQWLCSTQECETIVQEAVTK